MNKILPILILFTCLLCYIPCEAADPAIIVQSYSLNPQVLLPGDFAVLTISIFDAEVAATETTVEGSSQLDVITTVRTLGVKIEQVSIVSAGTGSMKIQASRSFSDVGVIGPGSIIPITFELSSHENMTPGLYFPKVRIELQGYDPVLFPIPVRVTDEVVELSKTDVPSRLSVSGSSDIMLSVINHLAGTIEGVQISPSNMDNISVSPESVYLGSMLPASSHDVHFSLNPLEMGDASISFDLSYRNGENLHTQQLVIPFDIIDVLDVAPVLNRFPSTVTKGMVERVSVEVYNAKTEEITGVIVTPITDVPISPAQYFIGSMDPDDVFSASFDVDTSSLDLADYAIAFKVSFKQDSEYFETPVVSSSFTVTSKESSTDDSSMLVPIGIVVVIVIIILFLYLRRRKRQAV
jgi:hypothetical protein